MYNLFAFAIGARLVAFIVFVACVYKAFYKAVFYGRHGGLPGEDILNVQDLIAYYASLI